nr:transposase (putative), gypsy type [Tanacetum cinerariifolium]
MGRDTIQLETAVSTISHEYLLEFTSEYGISEDVHPEFPGPEDRIVDFPEGKVGMHGQNEPFQNQLSRPKHNSQSKSILCVLRAVILLRVDERVFSTAVDWHTYAPKDEMPAANTYSRSEVAVLNTRRTPIQKQPEILLCLVGLSRRYFLGDDVYLTFLHDDDRDMDLFNLISAPNPSKVKTGLYSRAAHEVPLLMATASRVIDMEDPGAATKSSETPSAIEKFLLDFDNKNPVSIVLKCVKINKIQTISTQDQKPQRKAGLGSKFSSNNLTMKLNLSKFQSLGTILAQRSKPKPSKVKSQKSKSRD